MPLFSTAKEDTWPKHANSLSVRTKPPSRAQKTLQNSNHSLRPRPGRFVTPLRQRPNPAALSHRRSNRQQPARLRNVVRDDSTGALTLVQNSAVNFTNPCSPFIAEPKYRFLFGAYGNGLSMYTLDGSTGLIAEVPASPFAASIGNLAQLLVAESTGQYVYLLKTSSTASTSTNSLILDSFQIEAQT